VDAVTYVDFENRFRGSDQDIRGRVDDYVPVFEGASNVVDIGCGRGELLSRLGERGVSAKGVDTNPAMVALCRSRGLDVEEGEALAFLERQPDASVGGLVSIQVVEHFAPAYLLKFLEAAYHKLRPGAAIVLETINPACWMAFFETFLRDPTHRQALHPDTLKFLVQAAGFSSVDVQFRAPVPDRDRLPTTGQAGLAGRGRPAGDAVLAEAISEVAAVVDAHAETLNSRLFSSMDYVVVGRR
jgi:O-antigen chain-terminating methyltransferase